MIEPRLIQILKKNGKNVTDFDHFDYVEAVQQLNELELYNCPKRKQLVTQFATQCAQKITQEQKARQNKLRCNAFLQRMRMFEMVRQQKLQAMRFIQQKYDSRSNQLKFYPKINERISLQKGRFWKDKDGLQMVEQQQAILKPNDSLQTFR